MQLSIGVPTYNQGSFLGETLESLLLQEKPFAEIVVSENHCTDNTVEVLREFEGRVRVVRPAVFLTAVGNWNFTASQMTGEWFSLLSSDDLALPNFAADVCRTIEETPDATLLRAAWVDIDHAGNVKEERHLNVRRVTEPLRALYEQRFGPRSSFAAFAVNRAAFEKVGGFPEEVSVLGDWGLWLLAGALGNTIYCDKAISKYRAGHQEEVVRKRHHVHTREMFTVYNDLMPRAAMLAGLGRTAWIDAASKAQFRTWVSTASRIFASDNREQMTEAMSAWAKSVHEEARLERFARGEVMKEGAVTERVKDALRPLGRRGLRMLRTMGAGRRG